MNLRHILFDLGLFCIILGVILIISTKLIAKFNQKPAPSSLSLTSTSLSSPFMNTLGSNKKILMVIAFTDFNDEEYFVTKDTIEHAGYSVDTASTKIGLALGANGNEAPVNKLASSVSPKDYQAVVFIGGQGMQPELDNPLFIKLAQDFEEQGKIVSAICVSPALLAKAGILTNKQATVWSSSLDKQFINILKQNGAIYQDKSVVVDGNIITANGPQAAQEFGEAIVKALEQKAQK